MRYQCSFYKAPQELHRSFVYNLIELFCIHLAHRVMMMSSCEIDVNKTSSSIFCCLFCFVLSRTSQQDSIGAAIAAGAEEGC